MPFCYLVIIYFLVYLNRIFFYERGKLNRGFPVCKLNLFIFATEMRKMRKKVCFVGFLDLLFSFPTISWKFIEEEGRWRPWDDRPRGGHTEVSLYVLMFVWKPIPGRASLLILPPEEEHLHASYETSKHANGYANANANANEKLEDMRELRLN